MNRLWIKLLGAFGVVILIGVIVTVLVARQATATQLSHFMIDNQMVRPRSLQQAAGAYYAENGGWDGIDAHLPALVRSATDSGMMGGMMAGMMGMVDSRILVVDSQGAVVADSAGRSGDVADARSSRRRAVACPSSWMDKPWARWSSMAR